MTEAFGGTALRRVLLCAMIALVAMFATATVASAATLTAEGTTLVFTADAATDDDVYLSQIDEDTISLRTTDPVTGDVPDACTAADNPSTGGDETGTNTYFTCDGVTAARISVLDGDDLVYGYPNTQPGGPVEIPLTIDGGDGRDDLAGGLAADVVSGGNGDDYFVAGDFGGAEAADSDDTVDGGPGIDYVAGGNGDDTVNGGDGDDSGVVGGPGADTVDGGGGNDSYVVGGPGADTVRGGDGDDYVFGDCWFACGGGVSYDTFDDTVEGGAGTDTTGYTRYNPDTTDYDVDVDVTLDGAANDGREGENDNVDVENVFVDGDYDADDTGVATVVGNGQSNSITTYDPFSGDYTSGNDAVTPGGGNDVVFTGYGDDTINAVDGLADYIDCGEGPDDYGGGAGVDTANVDEFDTTVNCETVNVTRVGRLASENLPPQIAWVTPAADGGELVNGTVLQVNATDPDDGVQKVLFLAGNRLLCEDTVAPYECTYTKTAADVGKVALVAIAIDNGQQTATALRQMDVDRFDGARLTSKATPKRDTTDPRRFRVRGRLALPAGVSAAEGCQGKVLVRFKAGKKTISSKRVNLRDDCTYSVRRKFTLPGRFADVKTLRVFARFLGNDVMQPDAATRKRVRVKN